MANIREEFFLLKNIQSPYLNENVIRSLLMYVNNFENALELTQNMEKECPNTALLNTLCQRIIDGEPYQYVLNSSVFCGLDFYVDRRVLIPRNETEELTQNIINLIKEKGMDQPTIIDVCTGSGCIAISLANLIGDSNVYGGDISSEAIEVANNNNIRLNSNVDFRCGNLLEPFAGIKADVIVSNPPYIGLNDFVDEQVKTYEPSLALFIEPKHFFYEEIFKVAPSYLKEHYIMAFEISEDMGERLIELAKKYFPESNISVSKDMYGKDRFLYIIK